ncbi:MAG: bifunctional acetate--CoA ligase family protein/GNAT family N-acetyltransferase [Deltaproteobacteria bacterium]|nr:bifunctional acetate--CoA ligase family protein/GNAT family N-acetyltransferase [Deltaproteobacteria bacterium]
MANIPTRVTDPVHDILRFEKDQLQSIFTPRNVALIGATEKTGTVGRTVFWNLLSNPFGGIVFPVNPKRSSILGVKAYANVASLPEPADLAVVVTPALSVPQVMRECVEAGIKGAVIISAGFKEIGLAGAELERQIVEITRGKMRVIGPNCLGVMNSHGGLNATFAGAMIRPGNVGFVSQSGALCTAVLDWSLKEKVGFSAFVSVGSMLDVGWGDLIDYLGDDPNTNSIVIYMETVGDARSFLSSAREVALTKPIIVIKAGRTEAAAKAAASHTGSLAGSDEVLDAAFRRSGVLRVGSIEELFYMAEVLAKQQRPKGPRLTIVTNAGGPGVLATDALISSGGELAVLSSQTIEALNKELPAHWSHGNPIDILGDADSERWAKVLEIAAKNPGGDGLLAVLAPQAMTDPALTAEKLRPLTRTLQKPLLASWMGGLSVEPGNVVLNQANIPTFPYPDMAARVFQYMWRYSYNLRGLYETPVLSGDADEQPNRAIVDELIQSARASGRTLLTEDESKRVLASYGLPTVETYVATTEKEAVEKAAAIGFPVVLKVFSKTITHKTDVGGVLLNLADTQAVARAYQSIKKSVSERAGEEHFSGVTVQPMLKLDAYELIIGSSVDPQFGPVLLFGAGGQLVEVMKDRALALPPLNTTLARRMIEQTRIFTALKGVRGRKPVNISALEQLLVRFSQLVVEQKWIREIDINPLLASPERLIAVDARVVLHDAKTPEDRLPKPAIRPYPAQYEGTWKLKDGTSITIRPVRPEDEPEMAAFHQTLSERTVYQRYFNLLKLDQRVTHERLSRICFNDYDRQIALVATRKNSKTRKQDIIGVARLTKLHGARAEFAVIVSDQFQGAGLGTEMLSRLVQIGRHENIQRIVADILPDNRPMQRVCEKLGFQLKASPDDTIVKAEITL